MDLTKKLFEAQDVEYKKFHSRLIPTVDENTVIGVRIPVLRKLAKEFYSDKSRKSFMSDLPHYYYEENNIHAFLIEQITDYDECIYEIEKFLPYIDNWATCDSMNPKILKKHKPELLKRIRIWIRSSDVYALRFGIKCLMSLFLDEDFKNEYLDLAITNSKDYYVNMMSAWFFATALSKQYDSTIAYFENERLPIDVHNKAIQKAIESFRISESQKQYLKTLKRKDIRKNA